MRLVKIEWSDANGGWRHGWKDVSDMPKTMEVSLAVSVGYLVHETKTAVLLCPHLVNDKDAPERDTQGDGEIAIPKSWITRIVDLADAEPVSV